MADALLSPPVGGAMWAASAAALIHSARAVRRELDDRRVPLMGVLGAFVFAAQMINFTIPGTGSSGHLSGALILSVLLGPHAAFLTMTSIVAVQALFFADGGLLALGCNVFNMGFWACFVGYPLFYRRVAGRTPTPGRVTAGCLGAALLSLQLGAFSVVLQTALSGVSELPFRTFLALMQPIHLAIGIVEGLVSAAVVNFVVKAQPEILRPAGAGGRTRGTLGGVVAGLAVAALLTGGVLSWFASERPDGLEWSIGKLTAGRGVDASGRLREVLARLQEKTAFLPDYGFRKGEADPRGSGSGRRSLPDAGSSVSGLLGGSITLLLAGLLGVLLRRRRRAVEAARARLLPQPQRREQ